MEGKELLLNRHICDFFFLLFFKPRNTTEMHFTLLRWKGSGNYPQWDVSHKKITGVTPCRMRLVSSSYLRHEKSGSTGSPCSMTRMEFRITSWRSHFCFTTQLLETKHAICVSYRAVYAAQPKQHTVLSHGFLCISITSLTTSKRTRVRGFTLNTDPQPPVTLCGVSTVNRRET